jgi:phosphoribosylanthranilate isomerase
VQRYGERSEPLATKLQDKLQSVPADGEWFRKAQAMLRSVTLRKPLVVGVFQNQSPSDINRIVAETGIDLVQLHGDESASFCDQVAVPCLRVLHVPLTAKGGTTDLPALIEEAQSFCGKAVALVLDSRVPGTSGGGTGATFDWDVVKDLHGVPVILAGGLTTENVVEAIDIPGVLGVDVSSGVEVKGQPGKKDGALVKDFIEATRAGEGRQL